MSQTDLLASLPTNPACYGTSDIARLREAYRALRDANDTLALTLAEAIGTLAPDGEGCSRGWIPKATVDRWRRALTEAEEARP